MHFRLLVYPYTLDNSVGKTANALYRECVTSLVIQRVLVFQASLESMCGKRMYCNNDEGRESLIVCQDRTLFV